MKLVVAIVQAEDAGDLLDGLTRHDLRATRVKTAGGFLRETNATLLVGVEDERVDEVLGVIRETCTTRRQYVNPLPPVMEPGELYMPYPLEVEVGYHLCYGDAGHRHFVEPRDTSRLVDVAIPSIRSAWPVSARKRRISASGVTRVWPGIGTSMYQGDSLPWDVTRAVR